MSVTVFKPKDRNNFICRWVDPVTGKKKSRSAGTNIKREAERFAGKLEKELADGTYHEDVRMTWEAFRDRFDDEYLTGVSLSTARRYRSAFNSMERIIDPKMLGSLNETAISRFQAGMRKLKNSEATVKSNLVQIKTALSWAVDQKFIPVAPKVRLPKNTAGMKGRPITAEEFERMLDKVDSIRSKTPAEWDFLLKGLWWSGLRLGEALSLHWTDGNGICVDLESELFSIQAHAQKGRRYSQTPMAPEFVDMLKEIPREEREGFVFNPLGYRDFGTRLRADTASKLIVKIGEAAGIKVAESVFGKIKHASAHDLRRAFGLRWSRLIMPVELKELMRHEEISTTMKFYVGQDARQTVKKLRESLGTTLGTSGPKVVRTPKRNKTQPVTG